MVPDSKTCHENNLQMSPQDRLQLNKEDGEECEDKYDTRRNKYLPRMQNSGTNLFVDLPEPIRKRLRIPRSALME